MKEISIIIPVYNGEKYIRKCLDTLIIAINDRENIEILIINDGSIDSTRSILQEYFEKNKELIKIFDKNNSGVSDSRNIGIKNSTGKWLLFIDADDFVKKNTIILIEKAIKNNNSKDIIIFNYNIFYSKDKIFNKVIKINKFNKNTIIHSILALYSSPCGKIYKKKLIENNNIYFSNLLKIGEDLEWLIRIFNNTEKIEVLEEYEYYYYFQNENSVSKRVNENIFDIYCSFKNIKNLKTSEEYKELLYSVYFVHYCYTVNRYFNLPNEKKIKYKEILEDFRKDIFKKFNRKNKYFIYLERKNKIRYIFFKYKLIKMYEVIYKVREKCINFL